MLALVAGLLVLAVAVVAQPPTTDGYVGRYIGAIIPTPQEVTYEAFAWQLADAIQAESSACLVLPPTPTPAEEAAAAEIVARIQILSGGVEIPVLRGETEPPGGLCAIYLGQVPAKEPLSSLLGAHELTVPDRLEAYCISCRQDQAGRRQVLLAGHDPAGIYFAAVSLVQMMERAGERVVLHPVQVRDWPVFRLRSFKTGGAYDPGGSVELMGRWAPYAKFNCYNICYTTLGEDKWVNPDRDYRDLVRRCVQHMRQRGLDCMPFVNPYYLWKEHIETSDEGDLEKLFETCRLGLEAGGTRVMLCLDDFASEGNWSGPALYQVRSERDRARWGDDLAAVNVAMINDLHRRLQEAYPGSQLYVVLPYYWNPGGAWRQAAEDYLRTVGREVHPDVRFVWTGPAVRSAVISGRDISYYQGLLGDRKVMLWDNTLYMHHNPPHYFLDSFRTRYAPRFWELSSGEVHLNAGGGEAYKCGLLAAADYLWNPEKYDPQASIRKAIAVIAGPECVDDLLAFRDAFYEIYDTYAPVLGTPAQFLERVKKLQSSPFDEFGIQEVLGLLGREAELADKLATTCDNPGLVAEVRQRVHMHAGYREAFEFLATLPPMTEQDAANIAPNPGAEEVEGERVAQWRTYVGAGACRLDVVEGRDSPRAARLTATAFHDWPDGRQSVNVALMIGDTDGYEGSRAPRVLPLHKYYFSFWLKGTAPRVVVSFTTWDEHGSRQSRSGPTHVMPWFCAPAEWTRFSGSFVTPANASRGALKIAIEGFTDQGAGLGEIIVDDVYVGRARPPEG